MIIWGVILLGIAIGRLLDNLFGVGNVWGNLITIPVAFIIMIIGMYQRGKRYLEQDQQNYPGNG